MRKRTILVLIFCAALIASTICLAQPQGNRGGARGNFGGFGFGFGFGQMTPPGPPAPVPAEVAMLRPTEQEVAKINAALQEFANKNNSAAKDLLKKYASLLKIEVLRDNPCIRPTGGGVRAPRHDAFVEIAKNEKFDILFHGDSITDWWSQPGPDGGKEVQEKHFGDIKIANFAVAGDTTQGLLWGLQEGEGQGHKPKAIMLMIGTNSAGNSSGAEIAEGVGAVILELRKDFPDAKILLLAIFPRGANNDDAARKVNEDANKIIKKLDDGKNVFFMNINDKFLNADGSLKGFRPDNLHPNAEGYEIWANAVADTLKDLIK